MATTSCPNADQVCRKGIPGIQTVEDDQRDQIGQAELDSGNARIKGNKSFYIGEDQGQSGEKSGQGNSLRDILRAGLTLVQVIRII